MPEFNGSADKLETFQLKSRILEVSWLEENGSVGASVGLEVRTLYVAHGAPLSITVKNREGKTLRMIDGVVYADLFRKRIRLEKEAAGGVFFEVELPKHGLKATGPRLAVGPVVRLYEPSWKSKDGGKADKIKRGMDLLVEVKAENIPDGADARILFKERVSETLVKDINSVPCTVKDGKISLAWRFEYPRDASLHSSAGAKKKTGEKYHHPKVFFQAWSAGVTVDGPDGEFIDSLQVEVKDDKVESVPHA